MNNIDKALYKLFADKTLSEGCMYLYNWVPRRAPWNIVKIDKRIYKILWHEPQLHEVFRVAKEKKYWVHLFDCALVITYWECEDFIESKNISYNPTLSLMNQKKRTKQAIVGIFS